MACVVPAPLEAIAGADGLTEGFLSIEENEFDPGSFSGFVLELAGQLEDDAHCGGSIISPEKSPVRIKLGIDVGAEQSVDLILGGGAEWSMA